MPALSQPALPAGIRYLPDRFDRAAQVALVEDIRRVVEEAPLYTPAMPKTGKEMSVRMTNCGELGWVTDKERGYRYQATHPVTGKPWPPIPQALLDLWQEVAGHPEPPQACLVNFYSETAKMGLHQDRDESDFSAPVVSVSLGDDCLFRVGGTKRTDPTQSFRLRSGDVFVLGGEGRLAFHGVDRIYPGTSTLLRNGGRINLTLRRVMN
ncbi:alpha-ketoglutarate-dependent dioxygenase AlkB [Mesorhizobium sp. YM1C-6-2]|uniref:alpha-ketoglutarate-dependent dioxygenase AlkB family protein n=1 Tax=Mesorhizobium sp. YM1C-6-2 TaxID=1827501 RepID=UPI000EF21D8C|nr:alpha-ketoglutarate-dependent dioxygenase AlkB [Mesorhizobium sp. YM1C-6-2]RLP23732.1 alpha-ketoglutarate-dependent dioxygenase AlkB [Mesorhizobium sp. YM1C-6-2]